MTGAAEIRVLGPVTAFDGAGAEIALRGVRHKAVLARLIAARGRVVPLDRLVDDLWDGAAMPRNPAGAVRTFVSALRADLSPGHPRTGPIRTEGPGYAFRAEPSLLDADRFTSDLDRAEPHTGAAAVRLLLDALARWHGPAYADFPDAPWAAPERARLGQLRLLAVERLGEARLAAGTPADAVPDLDAHVVAHPWREEGWRLLALALYRSDRAGDALAVLRRARRELAEQLGSDPGPRLAALETDILRRAPHLSTTTSARELLTDTVTIGGPWLGPRAGLTSASTLLSSLAVQGGGPAEATTRHAAVVAAAEELADPYLTAQVIAGFDVPSVWTRTDDPAAAAAVAAAARRVLTQLGPTAPVPTRVRLLTTIARETRGTVDSAGNGGNSNAGGNGRAAGGGGSRGGSDGGNDSNGAGNGSSGSVGGGGGGGGNGSDRGGSSNVGSGADAAAEAERLARAHGDPALLATALGGRFLRCFHRTGLAGERDAIGTELVDLGNRHELANATVLGHLIRLQARCANGDIEGAGTHAAELAELSRRYERPLVGVFLAWYRALRADLDDALDAEAQYREAARMLDTADMPGLADGLLTLALAARATRRDEHVAPALPPAGTYEPWVLPLRLLAAGERERATAAVRDLPDPPPGHLTELLWCLAGRAGLAVGDRDITTRAATALAPAAAELAGAGTGMLCAGPIATHLAALRALP